ncbi:MAG: hypothetical protein IPO87_12510 [Flavobacteriales bacterium]|nr:hypothetical protein [Flavobacteriales bacterium]
MDFILALRNVTYTFDVTRMAEFLKEDIGKDQNGNVVRFKPRTRTWSLPEPKRRSSVTLAFLAQDVEKARR